MFHLMIAFLGEHQVLLDTLSHHCLLLVWIEHIDPLRPQPFIFFDPVISTSSVKEVLSDQRQKWFASCLSYNGGIFCARVLVECQG